MTHSVRLKSGRRLPRPTKSRRGDPEIMIVGGGPAGLSTWLHLQALAPALAARSILLEAAVYPREKLCGGAITPIGMQLLAGLGLHIDVPWAAVHEVEFRSGTRSIHVRRPNALCVVRRNEFDAWLARVAVDRGMSLHLDESFLSATPGNGYLVVKTTRAEYAVRVLVGADGADSAVRRTFGLSPRSRVARLLELVEIDPSGDEQQKQPNDTAMFDFSAMAEGLQGYVWRFPCVVNGVCTVNHGVYDSRVEKGAARADLRRVLSDALGSRSVDGRRGKLAGHPVRLFSRWARIAGPHVLLAGDAAGVDPALGEGIAPALDYGDLVANAIIDAFDRDDFGFLGFRNRLAQHPVGEFLNERANLARMLYRSPVRVDEILEQLRGTLSGAQISS